MKAWLSCMIAWLLVFPAAALAQDDETPMKDASGALIPAFEKNFVPEYSVYGQVFATLLKTLHSQGYKKASTRLRVAEPTESPECLVAKKCSQRLFSYEYRVSNGADERTLGLFGRIEFTTKGDIAAIDIDWTGLTCRSPSGC